MYIKYIKYSLAMAALCASSHVTSPAFAALITFDTLVAGSTSFGYDGDGDGINDVIFSTTDPAGFNTAGPGPNMTFIHEPGIEGTVLLNPDLRVDFLMGATGPLSFGFALNSSRSDPAFFASFDVFDAGGTLIGQASQVGNFTITSPPRGQSLFPEGLISVNFGGAAAFATFNFTSEFGRYIIDDFQGTFGSTERPPIPPIPEPSSLLLLATGAVALIWSRRKRSA